MLSRLIKNTGVLSSLAVGLALGCGFALLAAAKRKKPIHTKGVIASGLWHIYHLADRGVPLFDDGQKRKVLCRLSRSLSLGTRYDVMGLALRLYESQGTSHSDLLFVTTGEGRYSRYIPTLHREMGDGTYTTLLPLQCRQGLLWTRLQPISARRYSIALNSAREDWEVIGELQLAELQTDDQSLRFDPIGALPEGLSWPLWVRRLRAPSYSLSRTITS